MPFSKLLIALLLLPFLTHAQYYTNQNKIWAFGTKAGLDFTSGSPVPISTSINTDEGCASVSDSSGNLLFYSDGKKVYNRTGSVMPNGSSIVSFATSSATQAALIVPVIGIPNQYFLFSMQYLGGGTTCNMAYSIVDMTLDGGNGDVISASMGTAISNLMAEKMTAITGNHNNIWLITHRRDSAVFLAYNITIAGLNTIPVVSKIGSFTGNSCYGIGVVKASHNRLRVVSQSYNMFSTFGTELYNFDPETGILSNCLVLDSLTSQYGAEFSGDNTKLYTQQSFVNDSMKIWQYDISLPTAAAVRSSKTLIANIKTNNGSDLKLAPDNRIYFYGQDDSVPLIGRGYSRYLDCISMPNNSGALCGYLTHVVTFLPNTGISYCLPNLVVTTDTVNRVAVSELMQPKLLQIYPNPATDNLTISAGTTITNIELLNTLGQVVCTATQSTYPQQATFSIRHLPAGVYFARVNGINAGKVIKQ